MANAFPKVLYFIGGMAPSPDQIADADQCGPGVAFRNATLIHPDGPIEDADAVAGPNIPDNYAAALPNISDREAVKKRMVNRNPILSQMLGVNADEPAAETDAERQARIDNALSRGQRPAPVNERNADPVAPSARTTQSGDPRVTHPAPNDGWGTNPETLNDAADAGQGVGTTGGEEGQPGAVPVGAQGAGGPGQRAKPAAKPAGAGNPRRR